MILDKLRNILYLQTSGPDLCYRRYGFALHKEPQITWHLYITTMVYRPLSSIVYMTWYLLLESSTKHGYCLFMVSFQSFYTSWASIY